MTKKRWPDFDKHMYKRPETSKQFNDSSGGLILVSFHFFFSFSFSLFFLKCRKLWALNTHTHILSPVKKTWQTKINTKQGSVWMLWKIRPNGTHTKDAIKGQSLEMKCQQIISWKCPYLSSSWMLDSFFFFFPMRIKPFWYLIPSSRSCLALQKEKEDLNINPEDSF